MLTDLEPPSDPIQFWSWKKILAWFLGILTVFIAALLLYDEKLEPWDDLKPTRTEVPDIRTNGYLMLKAAWENLPAVDNKLSRKWFDIQDGLLPWDEGLVAQLNPGGRDLKSDLAQALDAPEWVVPFKNPSGSIYGEAYRPIVQIQALEAETWKQFKSGDPSGVLALIRKLRALSNRQIKGSNQGEDLYTGCFFDQRAGVLTGNLLGESQPQEPMLQQLASNWSEDQLSPDNLRNPVAGDSEYVTSYFRSGQYLEDYQVDNFFLKLWIKARIKPNASENRIHLILRTLQRKGLNSAPSFSASVFAEMDRFRPATQGSAKYLNANHAGLSFANQLLEPQKYFYTKAMHLHLFQARAVRTAIAIKRWQLAHGGALPLDLAAMVPVYLAAIPLDPWNGRPMRWDASTQIIYAIGEDWRPDLPVFDRRKRAWNNNYLTCPGLRLIMPPPAPPASPPKKSPKPAAKPPTPPGKP